MADSRIKDAAGEVAQGEIQALLNTLYLATDADSFSDFKKILLKTILSEAVVDANTNNYQAITPKAFYDSVMTTARKGIGQLSTDENVTNKTGDGLLKTVHQTLMQSQWLKDWFVSNGQPVVSVKTSADLVGGGAIAFNAVFKGNLSQYQVVQMAPPEMVSGTKFEGVILTYILTSDTGFYERATLNFGYSSAAQETDLGGAAWLGVYQNQLYIKSKVAHSNLKISISVNATTR